jgi:sarcosine oxidase/L-pipecolate oxidase
LDPNDILSSVAAGNDLNKILEERKSHALICNLVCALTHCHVAISPPLPEQDDDTYAWATIEKLASEVWTTDPIYKPHYHPSGFIYSAVGEDAWARVRAEGERNGEVYTPLKDAEAFRKTMPEGVLTGDFKDWKGFFRQQRAGWVEARDVLADITAETKRLGVNFITGAEGKVVELLYSQAGDAITGAKTEDGKEHLAETTILSAGAASAMLLDFEDQLRPTAWTLAHVPLEPSEVELYSDLPVLFGADRGFFISPPKSSIIAGKAELKICDEHPGYINLISTTDGEKKPIPYQRNAIPRASEVKMRQLLRETMPQLADRPLLRPRLCWDADTPNRLFLISRHPVLENLIVAAGGSGHGFMCSPAVGILVGDLLEESIEERVRKALGWRPETAVGRDWFATQGRFGGTSGVVDLGTVEEGDWFGDEGN